MIRRRRKNFIITFILILFFWSLFWLIVFFVDPVLLKNIIIPGFYLPFFLILFMAIFLSLAVILANSKKSFLISLGLISFLILKLYQLANFLNIILIVSLVLVLENYFTRQN